MSTTAPPFGCNIVHPELYASRGYTHEIWTWMRANDPVYWWEETDGLPFWAITKHADIIELSKQPDKFHSGPRITISPEAEQRMDEFPPTLIQMDPPLHGIYRKMVNKRFTPRALRRIHEDIERIGKEKVWVARLPTRWPSAASATSSNRSRRPCPSR